MESVADLAIVRKDHERLAIFKGGLRKDRFVYLDRREYISMCGQNCFQCQLAISIVTSTSEDVGMHGWVS